MAALNDLHQETAHAHAANILRRYWNIGKQAIKHPIESVFSRRARTARRTENIDASEFSNEEKITRIDGHAELDDLSALCLKRSRNHIATICDGGCAKHDYEFRIVQHDRLERIT
jgi:hypothetical protein